MNNMNIPLQFMLNIPWNQFNNGPNRRNPRRSELPPNQTIYDPEKAIRNQIVGALTIPNDKQVSAAIASHRRRFGQMSARHLYENIRDEHSATWLFTVEHFLRIHNRFQILTPLNGYEENTDDVTKSFRKKVQIRVFIEKEYISLDVLESMQLALVKKENDKEKEKGVVKGAKKKKDKKKQAKEMKYTSYMPWYTQPLTEAYVLWLEGVLRCDIEPDVLSDDVYKCAQCGREGAGHMQLTIFSQTEPECKMNTAAADMSRRGIVLRPEFDLLVNIFATPMCSSKLCAWKAERELSEGFGMWQEWVREMKLLKEKEKGKWRMKDIEWNPPLDTRIFEIIEGKLKENDFLMPDLQRFDEERLFTARKNYKKADLAKIKKDMETTKSMIGRLGLATPRKDSGSSRGSSRGIRGSYRGTVRRGQ